MCDPDRKYFSWDQKEQKRHGDLGEVQQERGGGGGGEGGNFSFGPFGFPHTKCLNHISVSQTQIVPDVQMKNLLLCGSKRAHAT